MTTEALHISAQVEQQDETLGTKPKFWFEGPDLRPWLFKWSPRAREDTAEWIACQLAYAIGLPAAEVRFAIHQGRAGIASPSFLASDEALFHGNELLLASDPNYPWAQIRKVRGYTVEACLHALAGARATSPYDEAEGAEGLLGHLLLDAWIGNTDRHHENWAVIRKGDETHLAPSYDHAASLGRNLKVEDCVRRLETSDPRAGVEAFAVRAKTPFYAAEAGPAGGALTTYEAFERAARLKPKAAAAWLARLDEVKTEDLRKLVDSVPVERITEPHRAFAFRLLVTNRAQLLERSRSIPVASRVRESYRKE